MNQGYTGSVRTGRHRAGTHVRPQRASGFEETQVRGPVSPMPTLLVARGVRPPPRPAHPARNSLPGAAEPRPPQAGGQDCGSQPPPPREGPAWGALDISFPLPPPRPQCVPSSLPLPVPAARLGQGGEKPLGSCCPAWLPPSPSLLGREVEPPLGLLASPPSQPRDYRRQRSCSTPGLAGRGWGRGGTAPGPGRGADLPEHSRHWAQAGGAQGRCPAPTQRPDSGTRTPRLPGVLVTFAGI